ncbi:MAG: adenylate/guanylate cyclase domain-containing protein [Lewinellaceae bacterium]|nr:adenylate/guanylate cyclase domain-containing protein [Lewinellaceae bacterium]
MIRKDRRSVFYFLLQMIAIWVFAWVLFYFLRQYGIDEYPYVQFVKQPNRAVHLAVHAGIGVLTGLFYGGFELLFERPSFQRRAYGRLILLKTALYLLLAVVMMAVAVIATQLLIFGKQNWAQVGEWLTNVNFFVALIHFLTVSILISFIRQMNYKFGPGVLWNLLIGKYHQPREEQRIFMFLDLRSSTTIAEKLGHARFTRLIQDCFFDLTEVVLRHKVDIYQYVGDEAILSWELDKGLSENHCLHCYFDFLQVLQKKADYYETEYGVQPFFKAGMHLGKVMVAEVGVIKKDIAYLGDVLNTAARIQGKCNVLNQGLLISAALKENLQPDAQFQMKAMRAEILEGKQEQVAIFGIEKKES